MKKLFFISAIFISSSFVNAQKEVRQTLVQGSKEFNWKITRYIVNEDTSIYFYYGFQNKAYDYISDIGSIFITSKSELNNLGNKLIEYGSINEKLNQSEKVGDIKLQLYDFSNFLYVTDRNNKYTIITKKQAIDFGKEMIFHSSHLKN